MPKIHGNQITPGTVISHDSHWVSVKANAVKPGKGGAFNQVELKNRIDARKLNERFRTARRSRQSPHVTLKTDPAVRGQTAASSYKPAVLENGLHVLVPPVFGSGERIVVARSEVTYMRRAD